MLSDKLPFSEKKMTELITKGAPYKFMNKLSLFNPDKILETNFSAGRHEASPAGEVVYPLNDEILILHYKYLSPEWTYQRHLELQEKLGKTDKENNWGIQYSWTKEIFDKDWELFEKNAVENVMLAGHSHEISSLGLDPPWWRR